MSASIEINCITERRSADGYYWRYTHSPGEPQDTLTAAIMMAVEVAAEEARNAGKTYVVASTPRPSPAVYIFASDHPDRSNAAINVMYELTPDGGRIQHRRTVRH